MYMYVCIYIRGEPSFYCVHSISGAYVLSDSLINYSPVAVAISGDAGPPRFR